MYSNNPDERILEKPKSPPNLTAEKFLKQKVQLFQIKMIK